MDEFVMMSANERLVRLLLYVKRRRLQHHLRRRCRRRTISRGEKATRRRKSQQQATPAESSVPLDHVGVFHQQMKIEIGVNFTDAFGYQDDKFVALRRRLCPRAAEHRPDVNFAPFRFDEAFREQDENPAAGGCGRIQVVIVSAVLKTELVRLLLEFIQRFFQEKVIFGAVDDQGVEELVVVISGVAASGAHADAALAENESAQGPPEAAQPHADDE